MMATSDGAELAHTSSGSWSGFLKNISSFSGDLSTLTAPPFILSYTSLTEYSAYWVSHPSLLTDAAKEDDVEKRAVLVLKWFISTLKQQYSSRNEKLGSEKKPLNPFLGELFLGKWEDAVDGNDLLLVSEQVSHHPPVTAYGIRDTNDTVVLSGYNGQKASVSRALSITIKQVGHAILRFPKRKSDVSDEGEAYLITLPSLHIEGLMSGAPYVELDGHSSIISTTGYIAKIDYSGKGWFSGKKNSFIGTLAKTSDPKKALYRADGQWSGSFCIHDASTKEAVESWDPAGKPIVPLTVAPIEEQGDMESRRAWSKVAEAIKKGDMDAVQREKSRIENKQRELRKQEQTERSEWPRKYFKREQDDALFKRLGGEAGELLEAEKTGGVWVFKP